MSTDRIRERLTRGVHATALARRLGVGIGVVVAWVTIGVMPVSADGPADHVCRDPDIPALVAGTLEERSRSDGELVQAVSDKVRTALCRT